MPPKNEKSSITEDLITALRYPRVADVIGGVINDKLRPLMEEISTLRAENSEQATKIVNLQNDLQLATSRIDELETFTRRDNLIISGLPLESYAEATGAADNDGHGESSECTEKTVLKLFNDQLKVSVTPADISIAHRLRKRGGGSTVNSGPPASPTERYVTKSTTPVVCFVIWVPAFLSTRILTHQQTNCFSRLVNL